MRSTHDAVTLLRTAHTPPGLRALAAALGHADAAPVPTATARLLGAPHSARIIDRAVHTHDGTAALLLHGVPALGWRDTITRTAAALDRTLDPRRWLLLATTDDDAHVVVATWLATPRAPRIAALVIDRAAPLDSDAQLLLAVAAARTDDADATALRWHDLLGRTAIGRRFFVDLERQVLALADTWTGRIDDTDRRTLAIVTTARLLFLKFLEAKGWLDGDRDFLARHARRTLDTGTPLWHGFLCPLVFGTLNTPASRRAAAARRFGTIPFLNGGLFARTPLEIACRRPTAPDAPLADLLLGSLARHRFTAREDAATWSEAAVDPDMLGRTFEALMHPTQRRGSGTFYTPTPLAHDLVHDALAHALASPHATPDTARAALAGTAPRAQRARHALLDRAATLRVLDPACGSGGLLVTALDALTALRTACGDARPRHTIRRDLLARSIFGVDIAPLAVWITELRCWLTLVLDDDTTDARRIVPLPNLDHNIRTGDALAGATATPHAIARGLAPLRTRYTSATGTRKRTLAARLDTAERSIAIAALDARITTLSRERRDLLATARARTLFGTRTGLAPAPRRALATCKAALDDARRRRRALALGHPLGFAFDSHFADAMLDGGFDAIVGNPPWIRPHRTDADTRRLLRTHFAHLSRAPTGTSAAFGTQPDVAAAFTERALALLKPNGVLGFVLPAKLWRSLAGHALRTRILARATPLAITDLGDDPTGFAAAVYPSTIVARTHASDGPATPTTPTMPTHVIDCTARDGTGTLARFPVPLHALPASDAPGAPWRLVPDAVRDAADAIARAGSAWDESPLPLPQLGTKTGRNAAFLVDALAIPHDLRPFTRPALRGESLARWSPTPAREHLVVPHDANGRPLDRLPAPLARHLDAHQHALRDRSDLRPRDPWWTLFRTELLPPGGWRVCWADVARSLRATLLVPQHRTVPLNSCYGVRCDDAIDAHALLALLNAPLVSAWLSLVAEPARGGFHRFLGFTLLSLPLPPWDRARHRLAPLGAAARRGAPPDADTLHAAVLDAYGIRAHTVTPLLAWALADRRRADTHSPDARRAHDATTAHATSAA